MKVILLQDVENRGKAGETVSAKNGYARNYLSPRKKGLEATPQNLRSLEIQKQLVARKASKNIREAEKLAEQIEEISCTMSRQVGDQEKLFGSVTSLDIQKSLQEEGIEVDRKMILLEEPIKALGIYTVPIKIHREVTADLKIWVVKA